MAFQANNTSDLYCFFCCHSHWQHWKIVVNVPVLTISVIFPNQLVGSCECASQILLLMFLVL